MLRRISRVFRASHPRRVPGARRPEALLNRILALLAAAAATPLLALGLWVGGALQLERLGGEIDARFEARFREQPSRVWSRPLRVVRGDRPERIDLAGHLARTGYREVSGAPARPGEYWRGEREWRIERRAFATPDGEQPGGTLRLLLDSRGRIATLRGAGGRKLADALLEPLRLSVEAGAAGRDREPIPLDALPPALIEAVLAAEDQRFFEHGGLDPQRIAGAFAANLRAGRVVQGGSTITQQLVKNLFLERERTFARKLREAVLAPLVEQRRSKREILEAYLNEVYLGQDGALALHGVGPASRHYFGKPATELELPEAALLAGILRGPSLYAPHRRPEAARERRDLVLRLLRERGQLAAEAYAAALAAPLGLAPRPGSLRSASWFLDALREELEGELGGEELGRAGLAIHTTLDPRLQVLAEGAVRRGLARLEGEQTRLARPDSPLQAALVALDPHSGALLAQIGGRDYARSQFDRATRARRQPGSVFKPVVALAALARQERLQPPFTLASVLPDEPLTVLALEGEWQPANHDGEYRGDVTLREALEQSLNVPIARLGGELGLRRIIGTARRLGIRSPLRSVPSLPLGTYETSLLEITRAYAVLAAEGLRAEGHAVRAVVDAEGRTVRAHRARPRRAFTAAEAYLVTSALEGAVNRGTGAGLRGLGFRGRVAGKTGTTDDYRDGWFVGYTPDLVVGVWVGFDDGASLHGSGSRTALPIFADFLIGALGPDGGRAFPRPAGIESIEVVADAAHPAGLRCRGEAEVFLEGSGPSRHARCRRPGWLTRFFARGAAEKDRGDPRQERGRGPGVRIHFGR